MVVMIALRVIPSAHPTGLENHRDLSFVLLSVFPWRLLLEGESGREGVSFLPRIINIPSEIRLSSQYSRAMLSKRRNGSVSIVMFGCHAKVCEACRIQNDQGACQFADGVTRLSVYADIDPSSDF